MVLALAGDSTITSDVPVADDDSSSSMSAMRNGDRERARVLVAFRADVLASVFPTVLATFLTAFFATFLATFFAAVVTTGSDTLRAAATGLVDARLLELRETFLVVISSQCTCVRSLSAEASSNPPSSARARISAIPIRPST